MADENELRKAHNKRHAGVKADRKAKKTEHVQEYTDRQRNPKAFTFKSAVKAQRQFLRTQNLQHKKHHLPVVDRTPLEPPPVLVAVVGGPRCGKSTLMRSLIRIYTKQRLTSIAGPVTVITGKKRRITFVEVNNDINCMIDVAKVADLVLLLIDVTFGIEMEVFEFLEICRAHGTPKVMGILNHLDMLKDSKSLKKRKRALKHRFQVELYPGAKLFYLTGMIRDEYMLHEIKNMGRFISLSKFRPLTFRCGHPYVYVDRWEDLTNPADVQRNHKCDRDLVLYGYVRGASLLSGQHVHIPGSGDYMLEDVQFLPDPCPLPDHNKKRSLVSEEQLLYAPFSGVGGVVYDKDAVYIDLGGSQHGRYIMEQQKEQQQLLQRKQTNYNRAKAEGDGGEDEDDDASDGVDPEGAVGLMAGLQEMHDNTDSSSRRIQVFAGGQHITGHQAHYHNPGAGLPDYHSVVVDDAGRVRRRALIPDNEMMVDGEGDGNDGDDDEEEEDEEEEAEEDEEDEDEGDMVEFNDVDNSQTKQLDDSIEEEEEEEEEEDDSDDADVDNIVPQSKPSRRPSSCLEPLAKKPKLQVSGAPAAPTASKRHGTDAFSRIESVLLSLEQHEGAASPDHPDTEDKGYSSCEEDQQLGTAPPPANADEEAEEVTQAGASSDHSDEDEHEFQRAMFEEARDNYYRNQTNASYLTNFIYGDGETVATAVRPAAATATVNNGDEDDFLRPVEVAVTILDEADTTYWVPPDLAAWGEEEVKKSIKDCFVTGTWKESEDAATLLALDNEDGALYGDFEDLETGEKVEGTDQNEAGDELKAEEDNSKKLNRKEKMMAKKRKLKEMFDVEHDDKSDNFDSWKADMHQQAQLNRAEFESLSDEVRVLYEGFRPGMYVRMHFSKMPSEFVINFDPTYPVIVGGLLENETKNVYNRVRMKVHRWYPKILKNRDPLILSVGWRRIQTMMYYGKREDDLKLRALKYARKYLHVEGLFWGPYSPVGTGFVAFQSVSLKVANFRIAANGAMLEADKTTKLVKKLKLLGHPKRTLQKTAYVSGMFHTETEVATFVGAKIQTQSGIRGLIKNSSGLKGDFRAKFEDSIKMSDVVILKTWVNVDVTKYCTFVRSLLMTPTEKAHWQGMKTVAQIKKEKNIKNLPNPDSLYTEITRRRTYQPRPLKVPRSLQAALPYKYKPKHEGTIDPLDRVLVVKDPHEEKMDRMVSRVRELMAEKVAKDKETMRTKKTKYLMKMREQEAYKANREKARKTAACKKFSLKHRNKPK